MVGLVGLLVCAGGWSVSAHGAEDGPQAAQEAALVTRCRACHAGAMAGSTEALPELVLRMAAIRDGARMHPPAGLDGLDDNVLRRLAELLAQQP